MFLRLAALGAFLYVAAQLFQWMVIWSTPPAPSPDAAILHRLMPLAQARALAVLVSFPCVLLAYIGVALRVFPRTPGAAITGLVFASLFVALELTYRSVDYFVVTQSWGRALRDTGDALLAASIVERVDTWRGIVSAVYFPLLLSNGLASIALAAGVWKLADRWSRVLLALLLLKAVQTAGRIVEMHAGFDGLATFNFQAYFPMAIATYGFTGFWLWIQGSEALALRDRRDEP